MNIGELIDEVRKPGKVYAPVLFGEDVIYVIANKSDFTLYLRTLDPTANSPFKVSRPYSIESPYAPEMWLI